MEGKRKKQEIYKKAKEKWEENISKGCDSSVKGGIRNLFLFRKKKELTPEEKSKKELMTLIGLILVCGLILPAAFKLSHIEIYHILSLFITGLVFSLWLKKFPINESLSLFACLLCIYIFSLKNGWVFFSTMTLSCFSVLMSGATIGFFFYKTPEINKKLTTVTDQLKLPFLTRIFLFLLIFFASCTIINILNNPIPVWGASYNKTITYPVFVLINGLLFLMAGLIYTLFSKRIYIYEIAAFPILCNVNSIWGTKDISPKLIIGLLLWIVIYFSISLVGAYVAGIFLLKKSNKKL